jgi:tetratricopeptide (TPR) repeat protein
MNRNERRAAGRKRQTAAASPGAAATPAALCEAGLGHLRAERYLDAQMCCQQALATDPDYADALHLMGLLSHHTQQYDHAIEWFARAIRQDPKPAYLSSLGTTLQRQGRYEEALKTFDKALQLKPDDVELWTNLGNVLAQLERLDDALFSYEQALKLNPRHWDTACRSAVVLRGLKRFEEAAARFELCDELRPNNAFTLYMRSVSLRDLKRHDEALKLGQRSHTLDPKNADTCNNIGILLQFLNRHQEALSWFKKALALRPNLADALNNKAVSLSELHRFDEAIVAYAGAKALKPDHPVLDWNVSLLHMLTGNFAAGWIGREARWKVPSLPVAYPKFPQPRWLGEEAIEGKTILIGADEGLGDTIQFVRYVPMLAERGARVILVVQDSLQSLLSGLPGATQCLPRSVGALPDFDLHSPICSLPLAFGTRLDTIPSATSYLPRPAEARVQTWEDRLGPHDKLRVGIVWSGNPNHVNDRNRSMPLQIFSRILDVDATFVSLQKDPKPDDTTVLREQTAIVDLTAQLADFADTAALIRCLDLVITVDTSVAHLAGALGCPTWILLPYMPDYRWLLDRDDSPWYPTARLFRQTKTGDYASVLDRVRGELLALAAAQSPLSS